MEIAGLTALCVIQYYYTVCFGQESLVTNVIWTCVLITMLLLLPSLFVSQAESLHFTTHSINIVVSQLKQVLYRQSGPFVWEVVSLNNPSWSAWWKEKLLSCYATSMLVPLVIICPHEQIKNGSQQPGFQGEWAQVKHRNVDCFPCSIRPWWTALLYWPVLLWQRSAVMPLPPCQHDTGLCLSKMWAC